ncbi:MAG: hypothetical protein RIS59_193 [Pseudomonadota bacterium]|jgi:transcriptional repressor NrdR|nr:transcriptional regulator NrdR [Burkholderiales bacterium]
MRCPFCGESDTQVVDSRASDDGSSIRRRRRCVTCDRRFSTVESSELRLPQVVKGNGQRQEFDRDKLRTAFARALHKRPVPAEQVDAAIAGVVQQLLASGEREIASRDIGERVMSALHRLDKVAYVRFASVYRSFKDVNDFRQVIEDL